MSHDYPNIASELLHSLGGSDNLEQAAHCVTRLRLALKNPGLVDSTKVPLPWTFWAKPRS